MASMKCKCGEILSNSEVPNKIQLIVYTDIEWDKILSEECIETISIPRPQYDVWRCPVCQRVYVFEPGKLEAIKIYALEK